MKKTFFFLPILIILCAFCSKDSISQTEMLLTGGWLQSEYLEDWDHNGVFEDAARPCEKDDIWDFKANNKFEMIERGDPCDTDSGLLTFYGSWELQENDSKLHLVLANGFNVDDYRIAFISDTTLILNWIDPDNPTGVVDEKFILRR